jgi:hypothetical protein
MDMVLLGFLYVRFKQEHDGQCFLETKVSCVYWGSWLEKVRLHLYLSRLHIGISSTDCSKCEFHTAFCFSLLFLVGVFFSPLLLEFAVVLSFCLVWNFINLGIRPFHNFLFRLTQIVKYLLKM